MNPPLAGYPPSFDWITEQLAVGGHVVPAHVPQMAREHRIAAVVDLRNEDRDDEALLRLHGMTLLHLPTEDMCGVDLPHLERGIGFANEWLDKGQRVLIHCQHGIGRSATLALCVMVHRGWEPLAALRQMKSRRARVSPSPSQFECWRAWLEAHRRARPDAAWEVPSFDEFQRVAYAHLMTGNT